MKHGATDYVSEYTVSVVELPNEEAKGKIIGKSVETLTHLNVKLALMSILICHQPKFDSPVLILFDVKLLVSHSNSLIKDGRIQPTLELRRPSVKFVGEMDKIVLEAGKNSVTTSVSTTRRLT